MQSNVARFSKVPRTTVEEFVTSDESSEATDVSTPPAEDQKAQENPNTERRLRSTQYKNNLTKILSESNADNNSLEHKHDDIKKFSTTYEDVSASHTISDSKSQVAHDTTLQESSYKNPFRGPIDPEYARILGSTTPVNTHTRDGSSKAASSQPSTIKKESKKSSPVPKINKNGSDMLDDSQRNYESTRCRKSDDEYREIFRRHNFSFKQPTPSSSRPARQLCHVCQVLKPYSQFGTVKMHTTCYECLQVIDGLPRLAHPRPLGQQSEKRKSVKHESVAQSKDMGPKRIRSAIPAGYVNSKNILRSLRNPTTLSKSLPKWKIAQEQDSSRLLEETSQIVQETMHGKRDTFSPGHPNDTPTKPPPRLIKLGIKTLPGAPPIWIEVSRSAPLGEMFIAALQSDKALRSYVFMLPDKFVRWDDTPDKLGLEENDYFEMHELPQAWLPNVRNNTTDASETPKETEKVSYGGRSSKLQQALHLGQMLDHVREEDDEEVLETTEMACDADIPKPVEAVHTTSEPIETPSPSTSLTAESSAPKSVPANTEAELPAIPAGDDHGNLSRLSKSRLSHSPLLEAETNDQHPDAGREPERSPSRSPSIVFLYSSAGSRFPEPKASAKRRLADHESHGQESKRLKQEKAQQEVIELKQAEEGTKGSFSSLAPNVAAKVS